MKIFNYIMKETLIVVATFVSISLSAQTISEAEALRNAQDFLQSSHSHGATLKSTTSSHLSLVKKGSSQESEDPAYYVFSDEQGNGGFVIVSGDSRTSHRILGYSETGTFNSENMPENIQTWLAEYADQIDAIRAENEVINEGTGRVYAVGNIVVEPLITTHWNQDEPYNNKCPKINGERTAVGCMAVSIGQIMNYHKWPKQGQGYNEYEWNNSWIEKDFSECKYDYNNLDTAQFLYDIAIAVKTKFGEESSALSINAGKGLMNFFGYDKGMQIHYRHKTSVSSSSTQGWSIDLPGWSEEDWDNMIRTELDAKRPVLLAAQKGKKEDGHAFICDGYDDAGYFHFNWGWGGYCDGWYVSSSLNPEFKETGYNYSPSIMIGLQPDEGNDQWTGSYGKNSIIWGFCDSIYVMYCMENDSTHEKFYAPSTEKELTGGFTLYERDLDWLPDFSNETVVPDGTYRKYKVYRIPGTDKYTPVQYSYGEDKDDSYETFKWVDVSNGVWTETSSRSFTVKKDGNEASYYIINDDEVKMTGLSTSNDTLTIDEVVSYRGKEYTLTGIEFTLDTLHLKFPSTIKRMKTRINGSVEAVLPDGLEELNLTYEGTRLSLPSSLKTLEYLYFKGTELTLPSSLERIVSFSAPELTELTIPASVYQLPNPTESGSSLDVTKLKSLIFEEGSQLKKINDYMFERCTRLSKLVLSEGLETIGANAFSECGSLKEIKLPKSVKKIEENAFLGCTNLESFLIDDDAQLEEIGEYAFRSCENLEHMNFPASLKVMNNPFYNTGLLEVDLSKTQLEDVNVSLSYCTSVILPNGVKTITHLGTGKAQSLWVPQGVETIEGLDGPSLMSVTLPSSLTLFCTNAGATFAAGANIICERSTPPAGCGLTCMTRNTGKSYRDVNIYIPAGATSAYENYSYTPPRSHSEYYYFSPLIEMVETDTTVNVISDEDGFIVMGSSEGDSVLVIPASVSTPEGKVEVQSIGDYAFSGNVTIKVVDIPASIGSLTAIKSRPAKAMLRATNTTGIGNYAFANCPNLEKVIVHWDNPLEISADVFDGVDLSEVTLVVPMNAVPAYQAANVWKDFGQIIGVEDTQDVEDIYNTTRQDNSETYNLFGQKVDASYNGVIILGGKKMLIIK